MHAPCSTNPQTVNSRKNWLSEKDTVLESLLCFRRAGSDVILTYYAKDAAKWLSKKPMKALRRSSEHGHRSPPSLEARSSQGRVAALTTDDWLLMHFVSRSNYFIIFPSLYDIGDTASRAYSTNPYNIHTAHLRFSPPYYYYSIKSTAPNTDRQHYQH
jgi:hypothetical protein